MKFDKMNNFTPPQRKPRPINNSIRSSAQYVWSDRNTRPMRRIATMSRSELEDAYNTVTHWHPNDSSDYVSRRNWLNIFAEELSYRSLVDF